MSRDYDNPHIPAGLRAVLRENAKYAELHIPEGLRAAVRDYEATKELHIPAGLRTAARGFVDAGEGLPSNARVTCPATIDDTQALLEASVFSTTRMSVLDALRNGGFTLKALAKPAPVSLSSLSDEQLLALAREGLEAASKLPEAEAAKLERRLLAIVEKHRPPLEALERKNGAINLGSLPRMVVEELVSVLANFTPIPVPAPNGQSAAEKAARAELEKLAKAAQKTQDKADALPSGTDEQSIAAGNMIASADKTRVAVDWANSVIKMIEKMGDATDAEKNSKNKEWTRLKNTISNALRNPEHFILVWIEKIEAGPSLPTGNKIERTIPVATTIKLIVAHGPAEIKVTSKALGDSVVSVYTFGGDTDTRKSKAESSFVDRVWIGAFKLAEIQNAVNEGQTIEVTVVAKESSIIKGHNSSSTDKDAIPIKL